ncbi:MAG TPA: hypothetical protein VGE38_11180 [Nocardioides sp.]|uniref:hypothetical protein n=1 Tax=Nocardioides sp. TaxID=35761 RepID=UPI002EDA21C3
MSLHSLLHRDHRHQDQATHQAADRAHHRAEDRSDDRTRDRTPDRAHDNFGGVNWGAGFFGWLVAVGLMVLLAGIASAIATAVGENLDLTRTEAEANAASIGLGAAIVLAVVMFVAYYAGGYVAGRMSRFDGARQGVGVWLIGLVVAALAGAVGAVFGSRYNVLEQVELPSVDLSQDQLGWGLALTAVVLLAVMLLGAVLGGIVGHRYHHRVDRAAGYR